MRTKGFVVLTFEFHKEGRRWVAFCEELGTSTYGRTLVEAEQKLTEATCLHLVTLEDVGETERFFEEHNIRFYDTEPDKTLVPIKKDVFIRTHVQAIQKSAETNLSPRENEILQLVAMGASNKRIADSLSISENTVKTHMQNIMQKLQLQNRSQVATFAIKNEVFIRPHVQAVPY